MALDFMVHDEKDDFVLIASIWLNEHDELIKLCSKKNIMSFDKSSDHFADAMYHVDEILDLKKASEFLLMHTNSYSNGLRIFLNELIQVCDQAILRKIPIKVIAD